jgi:hypothetical protein
VINLVMTDHALLGDSTEPARIPGYGPIPAATARDMIINTLLDTLTGTDNITRTDTAADTHSHFSRRSPVADSLAAMDHAYSADHFVAPPANEMAGCKGIKPEPFHESP